MRNVDSTKSYSETQNPSYNEQNMEFYNQLKLRLLNFSGNETIILLEFGFCYKKLQFYFEIEFWGFGFKSFAQNCFGLASFGFWGFAQNSACLFRVLVPDPSLGSIVLS